MRIRVVCRAALSASLIGGLVGCAAAPAPVCPAAALVRPPGTPPPVVAVPALVPVPAIAAPAPVSGNTVPPEPEPAVTPPRSAEPSDAEPEVVTVAPRGGAPAHSPARTYSGSSAPPQTGHAASRRPPRQIPARARPEFDLDEDQLQAQWINPPVYAGE